MVAKKKFILLAFLAVLLLGFFVIGYVKSGYDEEKYWEQLIEQRPYVLLTPKKFTIREPKKFANFIVHKFENITLEVPSVFKKRRVRKKGITFIHENENCAIVLIANKKSFIPQKFKNIYRTDFEFAKEVLYTKEKGELLYYKSIRIPFVGDESNIEIREVKVGDNIGFLYKGKSNSAIRYYYEIFFDEGNVVLELLLHKDSNLTPDEINYIVSSIKWQN